MQRTGRNDKCPCKSGKKYKKCHLPSGKSAGTTAPLFSISSKEPFSKDGFLTGRSFIDTTFKGQRARAVGGSVYLRPMDETFHIFLLRRFAEIIGADWLTAQNVLVFEEQHPMFQWLEEIRKALEARNNEPSYKIESIQLTGNMKAVLAMAYDFYSLQHCMAHIPPKLLNRLKDKREFQGARYEIAIGGLVVRAGFDIEWIGGKDKHSEFRGTHRVTGAKAAFEAKSHHRKGVLGLEGTFDADDARIKIMDHVRKALDQAKEPTDESPLIIFDDLNLPLTPNSSSNGRRWFKDVERQLIQHGFLSDQKYKRCILILTNFSWHFHNDLATTANEVAMYFFSSDLELPEPLKYLDLAAKQYGFVPAKEEEFKETAVALKAQKKDSLSGDLGT